MNIQHQIIEFNHKIEELKASKKKKASEKVKKYRREEVELLKQYLHTNSQSYLKTLEGNKILLMNEDLSFKVYGTNFDKDRSHAQRLQGYIRTNGLLYLETSECDYLFFDANTKAYPKQYKGAIDPFGNTDLKITDSGIRFWGSRIPTHFTGRADDEGNLVLNIAEWEFEFSGNNYVTHLICDPFTKNKAKRIAFLRNREILLNHIRITRKELLENFSI